MTRRAVAEAHPNIALVKYWGNRDPLLNLPASGSLSVTLGGIRAHTEVTFRDDPGPDRVTLNGRPAPEATVARATRVLAAVRAQLEPEARTGADVISDNDFPTGAGLASSAAGFAALAVGAAAAAGLDLPSRELSVLARLGSGSAARSIHGGFVELLVGARPDGADAVAEPLLAPEAWPLAVAVAVTADAAKSVVSSDGMEASAATSPFYGPWLHGAPADLVRARAAIVRRDLADLGDLAETNALRMHAVMLATRPALLYWNGATVEVLHAVRALRRQGVGAWATIDAGPQVKVLAAPADGPRVAAALAAVPGVLRVITCGLGQAARVVPTPGEEAR